VDQVNSHTFKDFSGGYNPKTGIFISRTILNGDYTSDVDRIVEGWVNMYADPALQHTVKGAGKFNVVSLKSHDGTNETMDSPPEPEVPDKFKYTQAYYSSPILRKAIDWFQCEKTRVRVFRQLPGKNLELHHDFDNERQNFNDDNIMVRLFMPLTNRDAYLNLANENSDVMVKLEKGQFAIINTDFVWHGSTTYDNNPRDMLNIIMKWNPWLHNLTRSKPFVDIERIEL
jgi:hypothetical protein